MSSQELAMWVVFNRGTKNAFKDMAFEQIHAEIVEALENKCLIVDVDENNYVTGIVILEPRLHIKELLATKTSSFGKLMDLTRKLFPHLKIFQAWRRNKLTIYKNPKYMIDKVINMKEVQNG